MHTISLLIKPASGNCNMRCKYCFYVDEMNNRSIQSHGMMNDDTLYAMLKKGFEEAENTLILAFQGGEPTLVGLPYFKKMISYVEELNQNHIQVHYSIQTNGYKLDEEWVKFFKAYHFLVGVSLDGNQELHDKYRIDAHGEGTFHKVMNSIHLLEKYEVDFNILTVIHGDTTKQVNQIYNFFKRNQFGFQQYIECLDPLGEEQGKQEYSLTPTIYGEFLIALFKKYYRDMSKGTYVYIRYFENLMGIMMRQQPESCATNGRCGEYLTVEADGSVYPCDFYVLDEWKLGNFNTDSIQQMQEKREALNFIKMSYFIPDTCKECKWFPLCRNGCRRNCEPTTKDERQRNYYCESYKMFFEYAYPYIEDLYKKYNPSVTG